DEARWIAECAGRKSNGASLGSRRGISRACAPATLQASHARTRPKRGYARSRDNRKSSCGKQLRRVRQASVGSKRKDRAVRCSVCQLRRNCVVSRLGGVHCGQSWSDSGTNQERLVEL